MVRFKLHFGVRCVDVPEEIVKDDDLVYLDESAVVEHSQTYMEFDDAAIEAASQLGGGLAREIIQRAFLHAERFSRDRILEHLSEITEEEKAEQ